MNQRLVLPLVLLSGLASCNDRPSRNQFLPAPTPMAASGSLVVEGPESIEPGGSARFTATLVDGTTRRDVTREANWSTRGESITFTEPGLAVAQDLGYAHLFVSYGQAYTSRFLAAKPAGTHVVRGRITPLIVEAAGEVAVLEGVGVGRTAIADRVGEYVLVGVAGTLRVRATILGHQPIERTLAVNADLEEDFTLTAHRSPRIEGRWRMVVSADPHCPFAPREAETTVEIVGDNAPGSHGYRITVPSHPEEEPMRVTLVGNAFKADFFWGDPFWEGRRDVPFETATEVAGFAAGEVAEPARISGTINGGFTLTDADRRLECEGTHRFEMRPL